MVKCQLLDVVWTIKVAGNSCDSSVASTFYLCFGVTLEMPQVPQCSRATELLATTDASSVSPGNIQRYGAPEELAGSSSINARNKDTGLPHALNQRVRDSKTNVQVLRLWRCINPWSRHAVGYDGHIRQHNWQTACNDKGGGSDSSLARLSRQLVNRHMKFLMTGGCQGFAHVSRLCWCALGRCNPREEIATCISVIPDVACVNFLRIMDYDVVCTHLPCPWHLSVRLPASSLVSLLGFFAL